MSKAALTPGGQPTGSPTLSIPDPFPCLKPSHSKTAYFDFLRLPVELRLMVYERLPYVFERLKPVMECTFHPEIYLVKRIVDPTILQACRQVYCEAKPIMQRIKASGTTPQLISSFCFAEGTHLPECMEIIADVEASHVYCPFTTESVRGRAGLEYLLTAGMRARQDPTVEIALYVPPHTDRYHFISTQLPQFAEELTSQQLYPESSRSARAVNLEITLAIQGLDISNLEFEFDNARKDVLACGIKKIVGVEGTPSVDWEQHWGITNLGSLAWAHNMDAD